MTIVSLQALRGSDGASPLLPALDERSVLHIRCGHDIMEKLALAGFEGDFLWFGDPYVQGPVPRTSTVEELVRIRARFLEAQAGSGDAFEELLSSYCDLDRAREYSQVNIWLEHDSYDQLVLAKLLDYFSEASSRPPQLRLIAVTKYPGIERFIGLGQLAPEALRSLWDEFAEVSETQLATGRIAWNAVTSPTPELLYELVCSGTPALPTMSAALARHLRELPSAENGLSLTEQLTLRILSERGAMSAGDLFSAYTREYEPLPFLGDSGYWIVLDGLANAAMPALRLRHENGSRSGTGRHSQVELLAFGQRLLDEDADWLDAHPVERWVGGVRIDSRQPQAWRISAGGDVLLTR